MGTNFKIPSRDIFPITSRHLSKIPEDTHDTFYNSASFRRDLDNLNKNPTHEQIRLSSQIHAFLPQDSPDLTQLNYAENKPVVGIINIPKSSTIRVLHSFRVWTNPVGRSSNISGKTLSLVAYGSSVNPIQAMVPPREGSSPSTHPSQAPSNKP